MGVGRNLYMGKVPMIKDTVCIIMTAQISENISYIKYNLKYCRLSQVKLSKFKTAEKLLQIFLYSLVISNKIYQISDKSK